MKYEILINGTRRSVEFDLTTRQASIDGRDVNVDVAPISPDMYSILLAGASFEVAVEKSLNELLVRTAGREFRVEIIDPRAWRSSHRSGVELEGRQHVAAPMPGKIVRVLVNLNQEVSLGQGLLVIEAMKMQNEIRSPKTGKVERIAQEGQTVNAGENIAVVT